MAPNGRSREYGVNEKQRPSIASEGATMNVLEHIAFIAIVCVLSLIVIVGDGGERNRRPSRRRR
jgi:hypothetical protein